MFIQVDSWSPRERTLSNKGLFAKGEKWYALYLRHDLGDDIFWVILLCPSYSHALLSAYWEKRTLIYHGTCMFSSISDVLNWCSYQPIRSWRFCQKTRFEASRVVFWSLSCYIKRAKTYHKPVYRSYTWRPSDPDAKISACEVRACAESKILTFRFWV